MDAGLLLGRVVLGVLMAAHGSQKLFGWFGGYGLTGTGGFFDALGFRPGRLFAAPTYFFVGSILVMVAYGLVGALFDWLPEAPYEPHPPGLEGLSLFLLLRSYAAGCTAASYRTHGSSPIGSRSRSRRRGLTAAARCSPAPAGLGCAQCRPRWSSRT